MKRTVSLKTYLSTSLIIAILCVSITSYVFSSGSEIAIEKDSFIKGASFIIENDDGIYKAFDGQTGALVYSGTNASTIIQNTLDALTSGRTWKEKIIIKGNFTISSKITIPSYTIIEIVGSLTANDTLNDSIFESSSATEIMITGGLIDGNIAGQSVSASLLNLTGNNIKVIDVEIADAYKTAIRISGNDFIIDQSWIKAVQYGVRVVSDSYDIEISSNYIFSCDYAGIIVEEGSYNLLISENRMYKNEYGIHFDGYEDEISYFTITDNIAWNSPTIGGFLITYSKYGIINDNIIYGNQALGLHVTFSNYLEINGNTIRFNGYEGMYIGAPQADSGYFDICDNIIVDNDDWDEGHSGIYLRRVKNSTIARNIISGSKQNYGIHEAVGSDNNSIWDNTLTGNVEPFYTNSVNTKVKRNIGFVTENSGNSSNSTNATWVSHGLAGTPDVVTMTINGSNYINSTCYLIAPTVIASNSTMFQIGFYIYNADTITAVTATDQRNIYWTAEYKP